MNEKPDVFISHAWADKAKFVRPLAEALQKLGVSVWYDEFSLELGDSISQQIDRGIAGAKFAIVVVSPAFIDRKWTQHELRGLVNRDVEQDIRILPIWHGVSKKQVSDFSPSLADKVAIDTSEVNALEAAIRILRTVRPDLYSAHPRAELEKLASGTAITDLQEEIEALQAELEEYRCPHCGSGLSNRIDAPMDPEEKHWDVVDVYGCGLRLVGGSLDSPCRHDPMFPSFEEYEVVMFESNEKALFEPQSRKVLHTAMARAKTEMAKKVRIPPGEGPTEERARTILYSHYLYAAGKISNAEWNAAISTVGFHAELSRFFHREVSHL